VNNCNGTGPSERVEGRDREKENNLNYDGLPSSTLDRGANHELATPPGERQKEKTGEI